MTVYGRNSADKDVVSRDRLYGAGGAIAKYKIPMIRRRHEPSPANSAHRIKVMRHVRITDSQHVHTVALTLGK